MSEMIMNEMKEKMTKAIDNTKNKMASIRVGRANVSMLDGVMANVYNVPTPLNQVGTLSAPEARLLTIDPWDKSVIPEIEKAILQANLGINPTNDGNIIRIQIPDLTEERRKEYVKTVKKDAEEGKVAIRNIRKDTNNKLRKEEKDGDLTQDDLKMFEDRVQKETDEFIKQLDEIFTKKEKELITV